MQKKDQQRGQYVGRVSNTIFHGVEGCAAGCSSIITRKYTYAALTTEEGNNSLI
ncbi:MAG: hypothetical protein HWD62_09245 [Cyclobacteriaceae bacterium]|nr:MAG: hypothetical protein HWD62_09245 [Cyclobacteriaceae bacterium]